MEGYKAVWEQKENDIWKSICTNRYAASTADITFKDVMNSFNEMKKISKSTIDIFVTTYTIMDKVKASPELREFSPDKWEPYITGIPMHLYHSETIARLEAEDLAKQGKKVCLITENHLGEIHYGRPVQIESTSPSAWSELQGGFRCWSSWSDAAFTPRFLHGIYS